MFNSFICGYHIITVNSLWDEKAMSESRGFFQLILLGVGVMVVFALIAYLPTLGISGPWAQVNTLIAPLILIIAFIGMIAYVVTHRR